MTPGIARALFDSTGSLILPESFEIDPDSHFCLVTINHLEFILVPAEPPHSEYDTIQEFKKTYPDATALILLQVVDSVRLCIPVEYKMQILKTINPQDLYIKVTTDDLIRFCDRQEIKYSNLAPAHQPQLQ